MSGGGGGGDTTTVQKADPWVGQQPYLKELYQRANQLPLQEPFPGQAYVPFSAETLAAQEAQTERATLGSPLQQAGQQAMQDTAEGKYLYGGEGFNNALEAANRQIIPGISSAFSQSGRYGGGLHQESLARGIGDAFAGLYSKERGLQQSAAAMAPAMAQADYADIGKLSEVGAQKEAKANEALQSDIRRWQFEQQSPYQRLQSISGIVQGGFPGGQSVTEQGGGGSSPGALTGAAGGALVGSQIMGGWGTAIGAAVGGLGSAMK